MTIKIMLNFFQIMFIVLKRVMLHTEVVDADLSQFIRVFNLITVQSV